MTPLLAEAAPDMFMEAVEEGIARNPKIFEELMRDDGIFGATAAILRSLADSYEQYAKHEDISSDLMDLRLG